MLKVKGWIDGRLKGLWRKVQRVAPVDRVPQPPPGLRAIVLDFAALCPHASVGDWIEFAVSFSGTVWREGYRAGLEARAFGEVELPEPVDESEEWVDTDYNAVPEAATVEHEPVILVLEDGTPYVRGD